MAASRFWISKLLSEADPDSQAAMFSSAIDAGVTEEKILEEDEREAFKYLQEYFRRYNRMPTQEVLVYETGIDLPPPTADSPNYWVDQIIKQYHLHRLNGLSGDLALAVSDQNVTAAIDCIKSVYSELLQSDTRERAGQLSDEIPGILDRHDMRQRGLLDPGIPTGFPYLDDVSLGVQPGDNWALVGRPEVGKSFVLNRMSLVDLMVRQGRPLILSMEMPKEQWARRTVALATSLSDTLIKGGKLSYLGVNRIREFARRLELDGLDKNYLIVGGRLDMSPSDLHLMIQDYNPTSVWPDGAAFMVPSQRNLRGGSLWERALTVMRELRQISLQTMVPMIGSYHFGRGGDKKGLEGVAHTDEIAKLVSVALSLKNESESDQDGGVIRLIQYKILTIIKGREGEKGAIRLSYNMMRTAIEQDAILQRVASPMDTSGLGVRSLEEPPLAGEDNLFD